MDHPTHSAEDHLSDDVLAAVQAVEAWAEGRDIMTGIWVDTAVRVVNVGISRGDEAEITDRLRALVPASVRVRARHATARTVRLRQFQVEVMAFLDAERIWGRWAVSLGPVGDEHAVEVGLLPGTPPEIETLIRRRFDTPQLVVRHGASHAIAL